MTININIRRIYVLNATTLGEMYEDTHIVRVDIVAEHPLAAAWHYVGVHGVLLLDLVLLGGALGLVLPVVFGCDRIGQILGHHTLPVLIPQQLGVLLVHLVHDHVGSLKAGLSKVDQSRAVQNRNVFAICDFLGHFEEALNPITSQ